MNKLSTFLLLFFTAFCMFPSYAQDVQVIFHETELQDTLNSEMVFDFEIINISQMNQVVFEVRTVNTLPDQWMSGLCFGSTCFAPHIDSIATTPEFFTPELEPGDTLQSSVHVFPIIVQGTANIQIQIATFRNPDARITQNFVATSIITSLEDPVFTPDFRLMQNYPNPFNPGTEISFSLKVSSFVTLKVFNLLGEEVASLLNESIDRGQHSVKFNADKLNSGVYLYRLDAAGTDGSSFSSVKKMILTK